MIVWCFFSPSKLQVIVPAPMFTSRPIVASPRYARCVAFERESSDEFFVSTKAPTWT